MKLVVSYCLIVFNVFFCFGQHLPLPKGEGQGLRLKGNIINYVNQPLYLYQCYADTLLLRDSAYTDTNGEFTFSNSNSQILTPKLNAGLFKIHLQRNQFFYLLNDEDSIEIKTIYQANDFYNIATDSLKVLRSEENKRFYEFQHKQQQLNVANYFLLKMMRLYPLSDPFHKQIEDEYFTRYKAMEQFVKAQTDNRNPTGLIAKAYYQPINPDWREPDKWRDSIIDTHYFDYFNPADSFYLHTNILPEKMDLYLALRTNKKDGYGQAVYDETIVMSAAAEFLEKAKSNKVNFEFCLHYLLKKFNKEHKENVFLFLYDRYLKNEQQNCEPSTNRFNWAREKVGILRGVQIGRIAPDFTFLPSPKEFASDSLLQMEKVTPSFVGINSGRMRQEGHGLRSLHQLAADYTVIIFWASWCPHCGEEIPKINKNIEEFQKKHKNKSLSCVFVSLDNEEKPWKEFIEKNELNGFINLCEFKGWNGQIAKKFNVYATPTMFLLDNNKKIIAKPESAEQLSNNLSAIQVPSH